VAVGSIWSGFDLALTRGDARELSLRLSVLRRCGSQPHGPNRFSLYLLDRWGDALNRNKSPEDCAVASATPRHSATARMAAALSQSETRLFARMCECTSASPGKSSLIMSFEKSDRLLSQNNRALHAISVQVPACSVARVDTVSRVVAANRKKLQPLLPEPHPTRWPGETNPTFRFVCACVTPRVSGPQDRRLLRFHGGNHPVKTPHGPGE
jgi:hypothetical protein